MVSVCLILLLLYYYYTLLLLYYYSTTIIKALATISHSLVEQHSIADDLQPWMSAPVYKIPMILPSMHPCTSCIKAWATANMFRLYDNTELIFVTSKKNEHLNNLPISIVIGNAKLPFEQSVMNFGFILDCHLTMYDHVSTISQTYNFELCHLLYICG